MNTNEHKARAAELGLEWSAVVALYREARELEAAELERITTDRREAFRRLSGDVHGGRYKGRNRIAFTTGDATYLAGLDVVAADCGRTADELYHELQADAPGLRPADDVMAEVIDRAATMAAPADDTADMMPLVAAAQLADITEQWLRQLVKAGRVRGRKAGRNWLVSRADVTFFARHPTAGRPRLRAHLEPAPF